MRRRCLGRPRKMKRERERGGKSPLIILAFTCSYRSYVADYADAPTRGSRDSEISECNPVN